VPRQYTFDFEAGLTERFKTWESVLAAAVYGSRKGLNAVAAELDMSPSELTRRLNQDSDDPRPLRTVDAVRIIAATEDKRPVYWLIETFLNDPETMRQEALSRLPALLEAVQKTLENAGGPKLSIASSKR
jgi:hypothetical protein